ncbi:hypothetical protein ACS0PU_007899 [Formica fusca]
MSLASAYWFWARLPPSGHSPLPLEAEGAPRSSPLGSSLGVSSVSASLMDPIVLFMLFAESLPLLCCRSVLWCLCWILAGFCLFLTWFWIL